MLFIIIAFIVGALLGGITMFFVYHNNKTKAGNIADKLKTSYKDIKDDVVNKIDEAAKKA